MGVRFLLVVGVALLAASGIGQQASGSLAKELAAQAESNMRRLLDLTNAERKKAGLAPLKLNLQLAAAAQWMAADLSKRPRLSHIDSHGRKVRKRLEDAGYTNLRVVAENIAAGMGTPESTLKAWLGSEGHRANILDPEFQEIGIGYCFEPKSDQHHYWVQDFGTRFAE